MLDTQKIIKQIDRAIKLYDDYRSRSKFNDLSDLGDGIHTEVRTIVRATIDRLAPADSEYKKDSVLLGSVGVLRALRRDYAEGYLNTIQGLIRAELFADFIEMAEHLLDQSYKDPAAVLVGGVLEEHLRALCPTRSIPVLVSGRPKKADAMNAELRASGVYNKLDQKNVTAWLDLRNKAAHAQYGEYASEQVGTMLSGVREFVARISFV